MEPTDEQIDVRVLSALRRLSNKTLWDAVTYDKGDYAISCVKPDFTDFARALLSAKPLFGTTVCGMLPADVSWGDPLTTDIVSHIAQAARSHAPATASDAALPVEAKYYPLTLTEAQIDAAIDAYDRTWCAADRGYSNKAAAIEAAIIAAHVSAAPQDGGTANASGDGFCEHQWEPMTDPHKECIKCGDVRPDLSANAQAPVALTVERCAQIADKYTCGSCGMDGKSAAEIRKILGDPAESVIVIGHHDVAAPIASALPATPVEFSYQRTFDAIAAATEVIGKGHVSISVRKFSEAYNAASALPACARGRAIVSLYQCEHCGCMENTALGMQPNTPTDWFRWDDRFEGIEDRKGKHLCSACGPKWFKNATPTGYGRWHGQFERVFLPMGEFRTNREGNLEHIETGSISFRKFALPAAQPKESK